MSITTDSKVKKAPSKTKASAAKAKPVTKAATHPPFADIIKECIAETGDRAGVSRPTIKKFIEEKYRMEVTPAVISNINRCIASGTEKGTFVLPKGPSGKVKLAPKKASSDAAKENARPVKAPAPAKTDKKPVAKSAKSVPLKAKTATKKVAPKPVKKASATATKPKAAATKKPTSKRTPVSKKALTGTAKPKSPKEKSASKKAESTGSSKRKSTSATKSSSAKTGRPVSTK